MLLSTAATAGSGWSKGSTLKRRRAGVGLAGPRARSPVPTRTAGLLPPRRLCECRVREPWHRSLKNLAHSFNPQSDKGLRAEAHGSRLLAGRRRLAALLGSIQLRQDTLLNIIRGLLRPSTAVPSRRPGDVTDARNGGAQYRPGCSSSPWSTTHHDRATNSQPSRCATAAWTRAYVKARVDQIARMIGMEEMLSRKAQGSDRRRQAKDQPWPRTGPRGDVSNT